jgi:endonuclease/exonuclease/phosphatase family metal-dependent hydrolase
MTWNIENFPKNGQATLNNIASIINELGVDLIALQEVQDVQQLGELVNDLDGYDYMVEPGYFAGLAYIYKTNTITVNKVYEIYASSSYWSPFPRAPFVFDFSYNGINLLVINNHYKCCGDGFLDLANSDDEETRRYKATNLIKDHIDNYMNNKNVIVVGDLNDELDDEFANNVFRDILDDDYNYKFADYGIAMGDEAHWSYPMWPSHLDHILITRELYPSFDNEGSDIQTLKVDELLSGGWATYEENVSDHRPVALKLNPAKGLAITELGASAYMLHVYPNPCSTFISCSFLPINQPMQLQLRDVWGRLIQNHDVPALTSTLKWDCSDLAKGLYYIALRTPKGVFANTKVMVN